jgi:hypothetical protein
MRRYRQERSVWRRGITLSWTLALIVGILELAFAASAPASAQTTAKPSLQGAELLTVLRAGGSVLYFRHADTDHAQRDSQGMNFDDCAAQRNLTERGRENARAIGEALRALGIPIGSVLASPYCRTVETAMLAFGAAEKSMAVREGGPLPPGSPGRFTALATLLSSPPAPGPTRSSSVTRIPSTVSSGVSILTRARPRWSGHGAPASRFWPVWVPSSGVTSVRDRRIDNQIGLATAADVDDVWPAARHGHLEHRDIVEVPTRQARRCGS